MNQPRLATVYAFSMYLAQPGRPAEMLRSPYKATREAIEIFEAKLIEGTGEQVPAGELDADGRYLPPPR